MRRPALQHAMGSQQRASRGARVHHEIHIALQMDDPPTWGDCGPAQVAAQKIKSGEWAKRSGQAGESQLASSMTLSGRYQG